MRLSMSRRLLKAASVLHPLGMVVQLRPDGLATLCPAPAATTARSRMGFTLGGPRGSAEDGEGTRRYCCVSAECHCGDMGGSITATATSRTQGMD